MAYKIPASGGGSGTVTTFSITMDIDGLQDFYIEPPGSPLADANYTISGSLRDTDAQVTLNFPDGAGNRTTTEFRVISSAPLQIGDSIDIVLDTGPGATLNPLSIVEYIGADQRFKFPDRKVGFFWFYDFPFPSGIKVGDLLILSRVGSGIAAGDNPAGWTQVATLGGADPTQKIAWKIADAGDISGGEVTVTHGGVAGAAIAAVVSAYRNTDQVTPLIDFVDGSGVRPGGGAGIMDVPSTSEYEWDPLATIGTGEAVYYTMSTVDLTVGQAALLELPNSPSVPVGLTNGGAVLAGSQGRAVCSFHQINVRAGATEEWLGNREDSATISYYGARIVPA